jgi:hypothetical protein
MPAHIAILPDFDPIISQRKIEICSENLKEVYSERFSVLLTIMLHEEQDGVVSFIPFTMNQTKADWPK